MAGRHRACIVAMGALTFAGALPARAQITDPLFADGFEPWAVTFRINDLALRDPHLFLPLIDCMDVTDVGDVSVSFNSSLQLSLQNDLNGDGLLDLSYIVRLRPLDQTDGATGEFAVGTALCSAPLASTSCRADGSSLTVSTHASQTEAACLGPLPGTTSPTSPGSTAPSSRAS